MTVYNVYRFSQIRIIYYIYQCSHCSALNGRTYDIESFHSYNDRGVFTKKSLDARREKAIERGSLKVEKQKKKIIDEINRHDFSHFMPKCSCSQCGSSELWADHTSPTPRWLEFVESQVILRLAIIGLLPFLICLFTREWLWALICILPTIVYIAPEILQKLSRRFFRIPKIKRMDARYLPVASDDLLSCLSMAKEKYVAGGIVTEKEFDEWQIQFDDDALQSIPEQ